MNNNTRAATELTSRNILRYKQNATAKTVQNKRFSENF